MDKQIGTLTVKIKISYWSIFKLKLLGVKIKDSNKLTEIKSLKTDKVNLLNEIESMKCCANCISNGSIFEEVTECNECNNLDLWELNR